MHQIPAHVAQHVENVVLAGHEVDGRDALGIVFPDVAPVGGTDRASVDDREGLAELVVQLTPPLVGEVGRGDDERPLDQAPELEFLDASGRAMIVLPAPGSSAIRKRMRGWVSRCV